MERCERALTDEATGGSVLQVVVLGEQGDDLGEDGFAHQLAVLVFGHNAGPHLDLLTHLRTHGSHRHSQNDDPVEKQRKQLHQWPRQVEKNPNFDNFSHQQRFNF